MTNAQGGVGMTLMFRGRAHPHELGRAADHRQAAQGPHHRLQRCGGDVSRDAAVTSAEMRR